MPRPKSYTPEQEALVLAEYAANGGKIAAAARAAKVPPKTAERIVALCRKSPVVSVATQLAVAHGAMGLNEIIQRLSDIARQPSYKCSPLQAIVALCRVLGVWDKSQEPSGPLTVNVRYVDKLEGSGDLPAPAPSGSSENPP